MKQNQFINLAQEVFWPSSLFKALLMSALLLVTTHVYSQDAASNNKKVIAYVTSWSSILPNPSVMTHINYAFGGISNNYKVFVDGESRLRQIANLKKQNPQLKVLLSIGGWGRGKFTPMSKSEANRKVFAQSCLQLCQSYGIDGIDIDWEFPGNNSSGEASPADEKQNYTLLMRDLREALGDSLLLTMASSSSPDYYDYKQLIKYLDFVNVMTYDMASPPYHHSALYRSNGVGRGWMVSHESIQKHLSAGIPADKLVMGLAFYGNGNGDGSGSANQVSLQEIEDGIASGKWTDHWDDVAKVPYVTNTKTGAFVYGYDNARSLTAKCQYILDNDLAGGMYWEYANDNRKGTERTTVYECLIGNGIAKKEPRVGDNKLEYTGANTYASVLHMTQGKDYQLSGTDEWLANSWYVDPDFFSRNDDGSLKFLPISGYYKMKADFNIGYFRIEPVNEQGNPLTYNPADGSGCVWVIGNSGIGKPDINYAGNWGASNGWSPTPDMFLPMAQIGDNVYQLTLTIGKQLKATDVNFKFFHQPGYGNDSGDEFNNTGTTRITTTSNLFRIDTSENGNVKLKQGASLKEGATYVFTLDCTVPTHVVLDAKEKIVLALHEISSPPHRTSVIYDLQGRRVSSPSAGGLYIINGKKVMTVAIKNAK